MDKTIQIGIRISNKLFNKYVTEAYKLGIKPTELIRIQLGMRYK